MLKDFQVDLELSPRDNRVIQTGATYWSHDVNTAKIVVNLKRNSEPIILSSTVSVRMIMVFDDNDTQKKQVHKMTIDDTQNGVVSLVLPKETLGFVGNVLCGVYVNYGENQSTDNGYFTFSMRRSLIDGDFPQLENGYVSEFQTMLDYMIETASEFDNVEEELNKRIDVIEKDIASNEIVKQYDLQVINNRITHGVDYIEPPTQGYKQGETWKPSEDDVGPFNMLREISNVFDNKTIAQGPKVTLEFNKVLVPEWGNNEYIRITSHINDFIGSNRARKSIGRYVLQNTGEKFTVQIDIANLGETDMIVLVSGLAGSKSELVSKKSVRSLVFQGERTISDFHIQFNAVNQEENISFVARNDFVTKGYVTMPYSENPYTLAGKGVLKAIESNDVFNVEDFEKTTDYNKSNFIDMQKQIDELKNAITSLGGTL